MMKNKRIKKAANGLQNIQAKQGRDLVAVGGVGSAAGGFLGNMLLPGIGGELGAQLGGVAAQALYKPATKLTGEYEQLQDAKRFAKQQQDQQLAWGQVQQDVLSKSQLSQYKKGGRNVGTKPIEIEGGEPHFSAPVNGRRVLKTYNPLGPTHEEGGMPVTATTGDAVVTAKGNKGALAVAAHAAGDHAAVEKIIAQMPADKGRKTAAKGIKRATAVGQLATRQAALQVDPLTSSIPGIVSPVKVLPYSSSLTTDYGAFGKSVPGTLNGLAQAASTAYNLGQGLCGDTVKTTRRNFSPATLGYADSSNPSRNRSLQAMRGQINASRNASGGSVSNMRANATAAFAEDATRQADINSQETGRRLQVENNNLSVFNNAQLVNNQMNDRADELDLQNAAKKQEALAAGLEGMSALAGNSLLQKNLKDRDQQSMDALGQLYKNYEIKDGKWGLKKRKGVKKIK